MFIATPVKVLRRPPESALTRQSALEIPEAVPAADFPSPSSGQRSGLLLLVFVMPLPAPFGLWPPSFRWWLPKSCACTNTIPADGFFGITLDVRADSRFWLLWLGLSHSAVRHCECRGCKSPCGFSASSSSITPLAAGLGRPATICFRERFLDTTRCPSAGCIGSTLCSALASTPPPRKSSFDDVLGTCSSLTSATDCFSCWSRRRFLSPAFSPCRAHSAARDLGVLISSKANNGPPRACRPRLAEHSSAGQRRCRSLALEIMRECQTTTQWWVRTSPAALRG